MVPYRCVSIALALATLAGCSGLVAQVDPVPQSDQINVYEAMPPGPRNYRFVKRLWIEPWKSAFDVPHYASVEAGTADLRNQAVALGGDAIINFACYRLNPARKPDLVCNGTVIKYVQ